MEPLFSRNASLGSVKTTSFRLIVGAVLKFWAFSWMIHMVKLIVGRAPGIKVKT
nr:hypothetical protein [Metallosphaera hakonensis]